MRIAFWKNKATNTNSKYVTLIAFPLQQWLHERASRLRYSYIACLDNISFIIILPSTPRSSKYSQMANYDKTKGLKKTRPSATLWTRVPNMNWK